MVIPIPIAIVTSGLPISVVPNLSGFTDWQGGEEMVPFERQAHALGCTAPFAWAACVCACTWSSILWVELHTHAQMPTGCSLVPNGLQPNTEPEPGDWGLVTYIKYLECFPSKLVSASSWNPFTTKACEQNILSLECLKIRFIIIQIHPSHS